MADSLNSVFAEWGRKSHTANHIKGEDKLNTKPIIM